MLYLGEPAAPGPALLLAARGEDCAVMAGGDEGSSRRPLDARRLLS